MRFLQIFAVLIFMALIGNLLKPLYWDRVEDLLRQHSDFGAGPGASEDSTGFTDFSRGYVTRAGFERFRADARGRFARVSDVEGLRQVIRANEAAGNTLNDQVASHRTTLDSLSRVLASEYRSGVQVDSLLDNFVKEERFAVLQGLVQGLHRAERGGGMVPTPAGKPVFRRRNLWTGHHQVHPPYALKAGGGR